MHTHTEASTPPEYANTTFSARPIDLSPWKTTKELLDLLLAFFFHQIFWAGGTPTPPEKMTMSGMGILPVLAIESKRNYCIRLGNRYFVTTNKLLRKRSSHATYSSLNKTYAGWVRPTLYSASPMAVKAYLAFLRERCAAALRRSLVKTQSSRVQCTKG